MNEVIKAEGFYISYNPNPGMGISLFSGDSGSDETALVKDGNFYILNGDYREDYKKLIEKGFEACYKFFQSMEKHKSSWSN